MQSPARLVQDTASITGVIRDLKRRERFTAHSLKYTSCGCVGGGITYGIGDEAKSQALSTNVYRVQQGRISVGK